jgi:hypothetical protein
LLAVSWFSSDFSVLDAVLGSPEFLEFRELMDGD